MSISLKLTGSFDPVATALRRISEIGTQPERVLTPLGHIILNSTRRRIVDQVTPDGGPFAALNPGYAAAKDGPGILRGRDYQNGLYGSLVTQAEGNVLRWGSNKPYAAVHQFGAIIKPRTAKALAFSIGGHPIFRQSVTIPARPYLGFTAEDREHFVTELEGWLARAMRR